MTNNKRWTIISKNGKAIRNTFTRDAARALKTRSQRIWDNTNQVFVR